jgi:hypothetical protein
VSPGVELPHAALSHVGQLMSRLGAIVQIPVPPMFHTGEDLAQGRPIAVQLSCDHDPRDVGQALEQLTKELLRGSFIASVVDHDIEHVAVLIHRPPQIVTFALHRENDFVHVLLVLSPGMPGAQPTGIGWPRFLAPIPHGVACQQHPAFGHRLFDVAAIQVETEIQASTVADDLGREPMAFIEVAQ